MPEYVMYTEILVFPLSLQVMTQISFEIFFQTYQITHKVENTEIAKYVLEFKCKICFRI